MAGAKGRSGGKRRGAGRKPLTAAQRELRGSWRPDRHGPKPGGSAAVVVVPVPPAASGLVTAEPPAHLSDPARRWWDYVVEHWRLDHHHLLLLQAAAEAWDLGQAARGALAADGLTVPTADGSVKPHPCAAMVTAARGQFASLVSALDLDDAGMPAGGRDGYSSTRIG